MKIVIASLALLFLAACGKSHEISREESFAKTQKIMEDREARMRASEKAILDAAEADRRAASAKSEASSAPSQH
jgi:uncharacterized protein YcfL